MPLLPMWPIAGTAVCWLPPLPMAVARHLARELSERAVAAGTLREQVAVAAVRADHLIRLGEQRRDADRDRFLAGIQVRGAADHSRPDEPLQLLLEATDAQHAPVQREGMERWRRGPARLVGGGLHATVANSPRTSPKGNRRSLRRT
jgi:hypothetical protein